MQRSCSNSRAEQRSSLDLGGTGRLLLVIPADADSGLDSSSGGVALSQRPAASASLAVSSPGRNSSMSSSNAAGAQARADGPQKPALATAGVGSSSRNERVPAGAVQSSAAHSKLYAAAARVWNSDDDGLTGYASMDSCL